MRPIFCGNFEYDARQHELERLFRRYGRVERVDMKSGFAFVYMEDERDGEDAIRGLDRIEFGRKGRRLRVEWTKQERAIRRPSGGPKRSANTRPSKTLFVINFDSYRTRARDLERHFDPYGKIINVRIRRNFAFIQFETQDDATRALEATDSSKLMDRLISVEYAIRDDDERGNGYSPERIRDRSPARRGYDRGRSPSPYRRERGSPDYGHGPSQSPYRRGRGSPDYGRRSSPSPYRRDRSNSDYGRRPSPNPYGREGPNSRDGRDRSVSPRRRDSHARSSSPPRRGDARLLSPSPHRRDDHALSPSPHRRRDSHALSPSPRRRKDSHALSPSPRRGRDSHALSPSPRRGRDSHAHSSSPPRSDHRAHSPSPPRSGGRPQSPSPSPYRRDGHAQSPGPHRKDSSRLTPSSPREDGVLSPSPRSDDRLSPEYARAASPNLKAEMKNSPNYEDESLVPERDRSGGRDLD